MSAECRVSSDTPPSGPCYSAFRDVFINQACLDRDERLMGALTSYGRLDTTLSPSFIFPTVTENTHTSNRILKPKSENVL